jgi:anti-sigma regulatory factor (Ser/Thr protein kinase)
MNQPSWDHRPPPGPDKDTPVIWRGEPTSAAELSVGRAQMRAAVIGAAGPAGVVEDDLDRLLLIFEELGSNGLRHGLPPVQITVATTDTGWVLEVSDAAVGWPPTPANGRDAADGGMGLHLVARLCAAHGWDVRADCKVVWGCLNPTVTSEWPRPGPTVPRPRGPGAA